MPDNTAVTSIGTYESSEAPINSLEDLVGAAMNEMREGNYGEAGNMLNDKKMATDLGYTLYKGVMLPVEEEHENDPAYVSWYSYGYASRSSQGAAPGRVSLSPRSVVMPVACKIDNSGDLPKFITDLKQLPPEIAHEVALVNLEEWLHQMQENTGQSLTNFLDPELDVAYFMHLNGIKLTNTYLARYDRGVMLNKFTDDVKYNPSDVTESPRQMPVLRTGAFVNVTRSNGVTEGGWQIAKFNPLNGNAIVRSGDLEKEIPRRELEANNLEKPSNPFGRATDFVQLFSALNSLPEDLITARGLVSREAVKAQINQLRSGQGKIEDIPTVGGLRIVVQQFLGL